VPRKKYCEQCGTSHVPGVGNCPMSSGYAAPVRAQRGDRILVTKDESVDKKSADMAANMGNASAKIAEKSGSGRKHHYEVMEDSDNPGKFNVFIVIDE
jgi:hypothetical protein